MKKSLKWLTACMLSVCTIFMCTGCIPTGNGDSSGISIDDIMSQTKPKLYNFSAKVYDNDEFDTEDATNNPIKNSDYFDDAYLLVDPGYDAEFINGYTGQSTQFYSLVERQVETLTEDIYAKLNYVYGQVGGDSTIIKDELGLYGLYVLPSITIEQTLTSQNLTDAEDDTTAGVKKYNLSSLNDLSLIAQLNTRLDAPIKPNTRIMPLYFANAINGGYTYSYVIANDIVNEGYTDTLNTSRAWAYANVSNLKQLLMLNIAEVLAGYNLSDLSATYSASAYLGALAAVDHLGLMQADISALKSYLLNKVIGTDNIEYDFTCLNAFNGIVDGNIDIDETVGNVVLEGDNLIISGNLGFDAQLHINNAEGLYCLPFIEMHNYKAYEVVIDAIVEQASKLMLTHSVNTDVKVSAYTQFPRLTVYTVPMDILDGSTTTNYDSETNETTYNSDISDLKIVSIILRPKLVLANEIVSSHQYAMGFNLIGIEAVFFNEIGYNVDMYITAELKANSVEVKKSDGLNYGFTQALQGGKYPSGSSDNSGSTSQYPNSTYTELLDTEKANTEWIGNQMLVFDGLDMQTTLINDFASEKSDHYRDNDETYIYSIYKLNTMSDVITMADVEMINGDGSKYLVQGYTPQMECGTNYLKLNIAQNAITLQDTGTDITAKQKRVPLTVLAINPDINIWIKGTTDLVDEYVEDKTPTK